MNKWLIVRLVVMVLAGAQGWMSGDNWLPARPVTGVLLAGMLAYGVIAVPVVVWAQRLNPRNKPVWHFPSWRRNPLTLRDPMQFFHMVGFVFAAAGVGVAAHDLSVGLQLRLPHAVLPAFGIGMIIGSYLSARLFRKQLEAGLQESVK
ncbi:MAG TPA: hypothetical protein VGV09_19190 [Steroidobacteraceae bacterium]|nr:hypothetical protein [Steroidobacteraceae bacterium]